MSRFIALAAASTLSLAVAGAAHAAISYTTPGSLYTQNFDSLPGGPTNRSIQTNTQYTQGWQDDSTSTDTSLSIPGWYLYHPTASASEGGVNQHQRLRFGSGTSGTGAFYSFGANDSNDRAIGMLPATTLASNGDSMRIGLRITNNTGAPLGSFTVTFDGEQYRDDEATGAISFSYAFNVDETNWFNAGTNAVFVNSATFTPPVTVNDGSNVDGNAAGLVPNLTATVSFPADALWQPGTDIFLRWSEIQNASLNDDGLAIDNVRFSAAAPAVPEPASLSLLALAAAPLLGRRRRRTR
jgi:hypothetical protein